MTSDARREFKACLSATVSDEDGQSAAEMIFGEVVANAVRCVLLGYQTSRSDLTSASRSPYWLLSPPLHFSS
jgi:hypothetical protein